MISLEWKGCAFHLSDPTTWPVDTKAFEARVKEFQDAVELEKVAD